MPKIKHYSVAIVEVLVLQRFPYGKDSTFFYYAFGEKLEVQVGDLIKIPWRSGELDGVVIKVKRAVADDLAGNVWKANISSFLKNKDYFFSPVPTKSINLKPIGAILEKEYFSPDFLSKLRVAAKEYFVSWNHFAKSVADAPSRRTRKSVLSNNLYLPLLGKYIEKKEKKKIDPVLMSFPPAGEKTFIFSSYEQVDCLRSVVKKTIQQGKQILVVVPEKAHLIPAAAKYVSISESFSVSSPILLGKFLPRVFSRSAWELTRRDKPYIFIGTRSGVFAPFRNLGLVIVEDGHDMSHKQWDLSPLYDTRKLVNLFYPSALKIYLSDTPRLQDFYGHPYYLTAGGGKIEVKKLNPGAIEKQKIKNHHSSEGEKSPRLLTRTINRGKLRSKVVLINTAVEKAISQKDSPISGYLKRKLISTLKTKKSALILINHKGIANLIICEDCGHVFRCPRCGKALSQKIKSSLDCRFCGFKEQAVGHCPKCSGIKISFRSHGVERMKEELLSLKKNIIFSLLVPPESNAGYPEILNFNDKIISESKPLIIMGYSGIIPIGRAIKNRIGLAAILDFDETLFYPDFRSEERAAVRFYNLLAIAPEVCVQTSDPTQSFLQKVINNPYSSLFKDWMVERKNFNYPPAGNILRIDIPNSRFEKAENISHKIVNMLKDCNNITEALAVPVTGVTRKGKYGAGVVVKYKGSIAPAIDNLFNRFGNLRIDPDPEEL